MSDDFKEAVEGIRRSYEDVKAGRTRPAAEFLAELRRKYDIQETVRPYDKGGTLGRDTTGEPPS